MAGTTGMRRFSTAERRARLGIRHRLAPETRAGDVADVARDMVALHSTDPSSVYVSAWTRLRDTAAPEDAAGAVGAVERALYEDRTLIRLLAMRRTVFVTTTELAPVLQAACADAVAAKERRKLLGYLTEAGVARSAAGVEKWLAEAEDVAERVLEARGEATAAEVAGDDARLATEIVLAKGTSYEGRQKLASRLLFLMAAEGRAVRGRPRGSWTSHQYRWSPMTRWAPAGPPAWDPQEAETELARRWLSTFGPGTPDDLKWWTGWTKTQVKRSLAALDAVETELEGGGTGFVLPDDLEPPGPEPEPWAALLPALDPTPMGWHERGWFLGDHGPLLFDRAGNIGPSVWWNGRIVGGWAQDADGEIVVRYPEDPGSAAKAAVQAEAERLAPRLGGVRLSARTRGRTWLESELAGK